MAVALKEYRNRPCYILAERFYIYAAKQPGDAAGFKRLRCRPGDLPTGVIVGTAVIDRCTGADGDYAWHLRDVRRLARARGSRSERRSQAGSTRFDRGPAHFLADAGNGAPVARYPCAGAGNS